MPNPIAPKPLIPPMPVGRSIAPNTAPSVDLRPSVEPGPNTEPRPNADVTGAAASSRSGLGREEPSAGRGSLFALRMQGSPRTSAPFTALNTSLITAKAQLEEPASPQRTQTIYGPRAVVDTLMNALDALDAIEVSTPEERDTKDAMAAELNGLIRQTAALLPAVFEKILQRDALHESTAGLREDLMAFTENIDEGALKTQIVSLNEEIESEGGSLLERGAWAVYDAITAPIIYVMLKAGGYY